MAEDQWARLRAELSQAGVAGADELGRFVNDTRHLEPSRFDERAAMPVLLAALPALTDRTLVLAVAGHLGRSWARPTAYDVLREAFVHWAPVDDSVDWALGDSLATTGDRSRLDDVLTLSQDAGLGRSRQMLVHSLGRYRADARVAPVLVALADDPDVGLHAMQALRRTVGAEAALPVVEAVAERHRGTPLGATALREARKLHRAVDPS